MTLTRLHGKCTHLCVYLPSIVNILQLRDPFNFFNILSTIQHITGVKVTFFNLI